MTDEALVDAIARELTARQTGAADEQRVAMDEIRALRAAAKQRQYRERCRAGIAVYRVTLPTVDVEELLRSFGASSLEELLTGLIEIDKNVTNNGMTLGNLLQCALENNRHEV